MRKRRRKLRVILDDGTPACLPEWAKAEIMFHRLTAEHSIDLGNASNLERVRAWAHARRVDERETRGVRNLILTRLTLPDDLDMAALAPPGPPPPDPPTLRVRHER